MMPQTFSSSSSLPLNQGKIQHELERLFGEIEQMLGPATSADKEPTPLANRWAYPPVSIESPEEENLF